MQDQINGSTLKAYQGGNQAELRAIKEQNNYKSDEWVTFLQAKNLKLKVKNGSKGTSIFKGFMEVVKIKNGKTVAESRPMGYATVFNIDQTEKAK